MCHICRKNITHDSQKAYQEHVRRSFRKNGINPVKAIYDSAGNCVVCGEAGRCPGWHTRQEYWDRKTLHKHGVMA